MSERLEEEITAAGIDPIEVQIQQSGNAAALFVPLEVIPFPTPKQIHLAIEKAGIRYGLDDSIIEEFIKDQIRGKSVVIARGKPPTGEGDQKLLWHDGIEPAVSPRDITAEVIDRDHGPSLFMIVEEGQQILSKQIGPNGKAGINIFGESVPVPVNEIHLPQGEGTHLSKDGLNLIASKSGVATWLPEGLTVTDTHCIRGSVDAQTGNITHDGAVYIEKDVRTGYRVEAMGNIYIGGNIEGADVYARGGSVIVRNGITGQGRAKVLAGRNIVAGFIQDAILGAKLDVEVEHYIINSAVTAGRYILAVANEGIVRGGTLFAEKRMEIRTAGADSRIETELKVGYTAPMHVSKARYQLRTDQHRNRMELAYVQKRLAFLKLLKDRMGQLSDEKEDQLLELERKDSILQGQHREYSARESEMEKRSGDLEENQQEAETIRIHEMIYPGVSVAIGDAALEISKERGDVIFFRVGDELTMGPFHQAAAKGS
jgi:uncharacterized protein (DUF342 family)